jgi:hypothetical protein
VAFISDEKTTSDVEKQQQRKERKKNPQKVRS